MEKNQSSNKSSRDQNKNSRIQISIDVSQYKDFDDWCRRTNTDPEKAIQIVLENINILSEEINKLKGGCKNDK